MRVALPLCVASLLLVGCLDWTTAEPGDAGSPAPVDGDAGADTEPDSETTSCPTRESVCEARCGEVLMQGCEPYACPPCDQDACTPVVTCASIQAQCGSLDTGCETVTCEDQCGGLPCVDNLCCEPEEDAVACRGSCGGTVTNRCGQEVTCPNPCGPESDGCREAEAPVAALCFCPHAWQGDTCEQTQISLVSPADLARDPQSGILYVLDQHQRSILRVDPETGVRSILSDDDDNGVAHGAGPGFVNPPSLTLDARNQRALVTDVLRQAILEVDLVTGNRRVLSDHDDDGTERGTGPLLYSPTGLALDLARDRAIVMDGPGHVFEVELTTGNRKLVSSNDFEGVAYGAGPDLDSPEHVVLDPGGDHAWVFGDSALMAVDLATDDRSVVSGEAWTAATRTTTSRGEGPRIERVTAGTVDTASGRAFLFDSKLARVLGIDLVTGDRSVLSGVDDSGQIVGAGTTMDLVSGLELEADGAHLLALDAVLGAVFRVDLSSGDRTPLFDGGVGAGPDLRRPRRIALDVASGAAYVVDYDRKELLRVDLATGARNVVTGEGEAFDSPNDVVIDPIRRLAYVLDHRVGIVRVALDSGARSVFSPEAGNSLDMTLPSNSSAVFDGARSRLIAARTFALLSVDLASGQRSILSNAARGTGPEFGGLTGITIDGNRNIALGVDSTKQAVFQIELPTGDRTIISGKHPDGTIRGQGQLPVRARGIGLDAAGGIAYVIDDETALLRIELATGDRSVVSSLGLTGIQRGRGPEFRRVEGMALDLAGGAVYVVDSGLRAVMRIDLTTGDRALVSKVTF